jgi:hypothetical protein
MEEIIRTKTRLDFRCPMAYLWVAASSAPKKNPPEKEGF